MRATGANAWDTGMHAPDAAGLHAVPRSSLLSPRSLSSLSRCFFSPTHPSLPLPFLFSFSPSAFSSLTTSLHSSLLF